MVERKFMADNAFTGCSAIYRSDKHRYFGELAEKDALARHTRMTELKMQLLNDRVSSGVA